MTINPKDLNLPRWDMVEAASERVHAAWVANKIALGITTRKSESGEELVVPYDELSEEAKELDRITVRAVIAALIDAGYIIERQ